MEVLCRDASSWRPRTPDLIWLEGENKSHYANFASYIQDFKIWFSQRFIFCEFLYVYAYSNSTLSKTVDDTSFRISEGCILEMHYFMGMPQCASLRVFATVKTKCIYAKMYAYL